MRRIFCTLLLLAGLLSGKLTAAPYYYFEHYTTHEGLPSNTIHCTYQDRYGFVWIGTRDGLCRFDGYDFIGPANPTSINSLASLDIEEDEDGLIWFSTSAGVGYYNPVSGITETMGKLGSNLIFDLQVDGKGSVWFAGDKIYRYIKATGEIKEYSFTSTSPTHFAIDAYDTIWVIMSDGTLFNYDKRRDSFEPVPFPHKLSDIHEAEEGHLLVATQDGKVMLVETVNLIATTVFEAHGREIRHILERRSGEYWIGTNDGLFVVQPGTGEVAEVRNSDGDPHSLSANLITSLNKDKSGNVWIGTYYRGINIWQDKQEEFTIYYPNPSGRSMKGSIVRTILPDPDGNLWFGTEDGGLNCLGISRRSGRTFDLLPGQTINLQGLALEGDDLWIFTFGNSVFRFDRKLGNVHKHYELPSSSGCGIRTREGQIYAGSTQGLFVLDREQDCFVPFSPLHNDFAHCLFEDSRGNLWVGTYGDGLFCFDSGGNTLAHLTTGSTDRGLTADRITSFFEDSHHRIWITTEGGGICYTDPHPNLSNLRLNSFTKLNGLANNVTCAVAEDEDGLLWVSTTRGIVRIDGNTTTIHDFLFDRQQIMGAQFSYGAALATRNGLIYMGNTNGLIAFNPAKMKRTVQNYNLYFTRISATNTEGTIRLHEEGKSALMTQHVRIKSKDASQLSISFAAPNYSILQQISFTYSLMRRNRVLSASVGKENNVIFSGLQPGRYRFNVGIQGSDAPLSKATLDFTIVAPPLWSTTAKIIYLLLLLTLAGIFLRELELKRRRDRARQLTKVESDKQKEIYDAKINFFTNITHEIRTPLSLIKMPLDKLIAEKEYTPKAEKDLLTMQANADRLLSLTNQLLDLRRMERNEVRPVFVKEDLAEIIRKSCANVAQMAEDQKIQLTVDVPEEPFEVMCVRDSIEKIMANLLSNGLKYTQDRIAVSLKPSANGDMAIVRVNSNGTLIPSRESEKIFEKFYQVDDTHKNKGTGLGLPFARSLAEVHGGQLYLDTTVRKCNSFVLEIPVQQAAPIVLEPQPQEQEKDQNITDYDSSRHTVLVVEDSSEMRSYLARELSDDYNIVTAANGQDAVEKLESDRIDLVVSDVMMPIMDGCQLCNYIKTNMEYSHMPVLLLTAAVGMETRMQTLEVGADGYIEKPFPIQLLKANISNLFKNREISYKQFTNSPLTHFNSVNSSKIDEEFMDKLHSIVMKHMAEQDLSIETLTGLIGTSKSTLYRKVKANTGLNINEYIRLCRLKQAAEMLSSQKYRINEVAYMVGFSSPSYFATSFQKQFNISPSAFVKNLKD